MGSSVSSLRSVDLLKPCPGGCFCADGSLWVRFALRGPFEKESCQILLIPPSETLRLWSEWVCVFGLIVSVACVWQHWSKQTGQISLTPLQNTNPPAFWLALRAARVCVGGLGLEGLKQEMKKHLCNERSCSVGVLGYSSVIRTSDGKCTQNKTCRLSGMMRNVSVNVCVNVSSQRMCGHVSHTHSTGDWSVCGGSS